MWSVSPRKAADKTVARAPEKERKQLRRALEDMRTNPMSGDVYLVSLDPAVGADVRFLVEDLALLTRDARR